MQIGTGVTSVLHVHKKFVAADRVCLPFECGAAQRLKYKVSSSLLFEHHQRSASFLDLVLYSRSTSSPRVAYRLHTLAHCPRRSFISIIMCQHTPIDKVAVPCMFDVEGILTMPASISEPNTHLYLS